MDIIAKDLWCVCKLCGKTIQEIAKIHGGSGIYYTDAFKKHLEKDHNTTLTEYFKELLQQPVCKCGVCKQPCQAIIKRNSSFAWREYMCGRNEGQQKWSKEAKTTRLGENNPMYGKAAWNKGLSAEDDERVKKMVECHIGLKASEESKRKMSESAKKRKVHGHTGIKHSEASKEKMRQATLARIKNGDFKQTETQPAMLVEYILQELLIPYEKEKIVGCWCFDFYLPLIDTYIEVDGDYFHSNPIKYPDGPKTKTQKINYYRDQKKNAFCEQQRMKLIRFWENDILNDFFRIKDVICQLAK